MLRLSCGKGSITNRKRNGNGTGTGREGSGNEVGREWKNEGQNNIFCAKTCKCQIFFVTLQAGNVLTEIRDED